MRPEPVDDAAREEPGDGRHQRTDRHHHAHPHGVQSERSCEIERPDHHRRHHDRRDEDRRGESGAEGAVAEHPRPRPRGCRPRTIGRQGASCQQEVRDPERHVHEEHHPPAGSGDEQSADRRTERGADRGHRAEESHRAADAPLRHGLADHRHGERHHDRGAESLHRARGDEHRKCRCGATEQRGHREERDPREEQSPASDEVAETSGADDERRDRDEVCDHDPLHRAEGGAERVRQGRQRDVGDARVERWHQHG